MKENNNPQSLFFARLSGCLPPHISLSQWLSDTLDIDPSNAYRRMRGEKELSFTEYLKICDHIPQACQFLNGRHEGNSGVNGQLAHFYDWPSLRDYLKNIISQLEKLQKTEHKIYYVARDLPLFFFYASPSLIKYKISLWLGSGGGKMDTIPQDIIELGVELFEIYKTLNTEELWYRWSFINQLEQLSYWRSMDYLSREDQIEIGESINDTLFLYEKWLESGQKSSGGKLEISILEFCTMNNGGLLVWEGEKLLMNGFQGTHFLVTSSKTATDMFEHHWKAHLQLAQSISGNNSRFRHSHFKQVREAIGSHAEEK